MVGEKDLYNIPGDTGWPWRMDKFVEYQHAVPAIHPMFLDGYMLNNQEGFTKDDYVWLSWLISCTYNEITTVFVFDRLKQKFGDINQVEKDWCDDFWRCHREDLVFNSARRYVKANNQFTQLIMDFKTLTKGSPYDWVQKHITDVDPVVNYTKLLKAIRTVPNVGRFSGDLFMESLLHITKRYGFFNIEEDNKFDWAQCANLTSGLFNILYMDDKANHYDKAKTVSEIDEAVLMKGLLAVQKRVQETYPEQDGRITMMITKICSFRNLFKGTRYAGYHHDRELECLLKYQKTFPQYKDLWNECFQIRKDKFSPILLGEIGGWTGIRKERKKLFLTEGLTGAEHHT